MNNQENTMNQEEQKDQDTVIVANGQEYKYSEMTDKQKLIVSHVADLNGKVVAAKFNLEQLQFAKLAFENELQNLLEAPEEEAEQD